MTAFDTCLAIILHEEGGYVNNKADPGGMTNLGITRNTWEAWSKKAASEADMRALKPATVAPLYRANYWSPLCCDRLPPALALCVFDFGVNTGTKRAARYLQQFVGAFADGNIGPATLAAVDGWIAVHGVAAAVRGYQEARRSFYRQLATFKTFGKGWLRRVDEVQALALGMIP